MNVFALPKEESLRTVREEGNVESRKEGIRMRCREGRKEDVTGSLKG